MGIPARAASFEAMRGVTLARDPAVIVASRRVSPALCWLTAVPLILGAFVDLGRSVSLGPLSVMGTLTIVQVLLLAVGLIACRSFPKRLLAVVFPYLALLFWAFASTVWVPPYVNGVQNLMVYTLFGFAVLLAGTVSASVPADMIRTITRGMHCVDAVAFVILVVNLVVAGRPLTEEDWSVGPRSFALVGLVAISWHLAGAFHGQRGSWFRVMLWLAAIFVSLSRMAAAVGLLYVLIVLMLQFRFRPRSLTTNVPQYIAVAGVLLALGLYSTPLADRFFTGDTSIEVGDMRINASGRLNIWPHVMASARESPVIGKGLGSSHVAVTAAVPTATHPHNDYLRIGHDLGLVGFLLFCAALVTWLVAFIVRWRQAVNVDTDGARLQLAALLGLVGLATTMMTDNAAVYSFFMGPLGVLIGAALGRPRAARFRNGNQLYVARRDADGRRR
jgi:O-antigen ligase